MAAAYLKNRTPQKALKVETPFKMLHGEEADLSYLRIMRARTFVHVKNSRKLDAVAWEGNACGYSEERKSYRVWNPKITAAWRAGTSPSSRHRPTCFPHLQSSLRCKI